MTGVQTCALPIFVPTGFSEAEHVNLACKAASPWEAHEPVLDDLEFAVNSALGPGQELNDHRNRFLQQLDRLSMPSRSLHPEIGRASCRERV